MSFKKITLVASIAATLMSFGASAYNSIDEIASLKYNPNVAKSDIISEEGQRQKAQRDAALSLGAQYGYYAYMDALKKNIREKSDYLDSVFDFNTLMKLTSDGYDELYLLPPVIAEIDNSIKLSDDAKTITLADKDWLELREARLVTSAPNWRQYLLFDREVEISSPPNVLLPKSIMEEKLWKEWVSQGWESGKAQADREMARRAESLGRDYNGMWRFYRLSLINKSKKPIVVSSYQEVVGTETHMREGERVIKLQVGAGFNTNPEQWDALILDSRGSYRAPIEKPDYENKFN
ncbi:type IV secretory system conjugative DNA transfer family protein [Vibrio parahaemolyticus]|uniref:type IV secretory system conjugative DNA transfer family protein n=1 Tax=Vibrio parahaemolyticus TaxID=670 RepID=UPI00226A9AE6|nr:type IV secretory system conjugative DNA transfer family protein [Vibrio parahaemolyticus]MCX8796205.1 type IV secretion system DotC family protein [Vibrio parahaemolyticus]